MGLDDVVTSLDSLNTATLRSAIEFQGFTKTITSAAAGTEGAGKAWTTFSRLVSGSPIWALQNKARAYLSILAGFENRSKANTKAKKEEEQKFVKKVHAMKEVNEQYKFMNENIKEAIEETKLQGMAFEEVYGTKVRASMHKIAIEEENLIKLQKKKMPPTTAHKRQRDNQIKALRAKIDVEKENLATMQKLHDSTTEAIKNTKEYALAIAAGASEQMAMAQGSLQLQARMKDLKADEKEMTRAAKEAYAFDEKRIETAKKMAAVQAKAMGLSKKETKKAVKTAGRMQKKKMDKEQGIILGTLAKEKDKELLPDINDLKPLLALAAPVAGIFKLAKDRKKLALKMMKFTNSVKSVLDIAFRYFMFGVIAIIGFMALIPVFFAIKDMIEPFKKDIMHYGGRLIDFGKDIFGVIKAFMDDGFDEGIKKIGPLVDTAIGLLVDLGQGLFMIGSALLLGLIDMALNFVTKFLTDPEFREPIIERLFQIGKIILAAWFVKTLLANAIHLVGIYALPAMMLVVGFILLYKIGKWFYQNYMMIFEAIGDFLFVVGTKTLEALDYIFTGGWLDGLKKMLYSVGNWAIDKAGDLFDWFANGGVVGTSPMQIVGERGPELVSLPKGSRINTAQQTKSMVANSGSQVNTYITINARDTSDAELRRIADRIGSMVNSKINRTTSSRTLG